MMVNILILATAILLTFLVVFLVVFLLMVLLRQTTFTEGEKKAGDDEWNE